MYSCVYVKVKKKEEHTQKVEGGQKYIYMIVEWDDEMEKDSVDESEYSK